MADALKFFSQEWCDAAREAVNANPEVYKGFKDANSFTNSMAFRTVDGGPVTTMEWDKGKLISWSPTTEIDEDSLWVIVDGPISTWQQGAAGDELAGKLLMSGKMKLAKGPMSAAVENAGALNNFLLTWGQVPTNWTP